MQAKNDVPYALVLAIIEYESGYEFDKTGDNGNSKGYMQIYEKWHTDRMQKLNCIDLMNPYQNVKVGIDFLSYLLKKYGTVQDALAAYNYGERGARETFVEQRRVCLFIQHGNHAENERD